MTTMSLASLLLSETKAAIYQAALTIAAAVGLPVSSWQTGDPTRTLYYAHAEALEARDQVASGYIGSGFLDYAEGEWLKIHAQQQFGVEVPGATYASTTMTLTNTGGGVYDFEPGDLTFKNSTTNKTYRNTGSVHLDAVGGPEAQATVDAVADEAGSDSSAAAGEIDDFVSGPLGVECTNLVAAIGVDEQSETTTREQCRARRGRATPNGPKDAYTDVALDPALTGTNGITQARSYGDSDTGDVTLYLAGPGGAVSEDDRAAVELAVLENATPLCITPTVLSCSNVTVPVTYSLWLYKRANKTADEAEEEIEEALEQMFAARPIGGDILEGEETGKLYASLIESTIRSVYNEDAFRVVMSLPADDTALTNGQKAALGAITATINIVKDPT